MASASETKALAAMRALLALGVADEETLVLHAAEAVGGDDARRIAQRVFDRRFAISGAV